MQRGESQRGGRQRPREGIPVLLAHDRGCISLQFWQRAGRHPNCHGAVTRNTPWPALACPGTWGGRQGPSGLRCPLRGLCPRPALGLPALGRNLQQEPRLLPGWFWQEREASPQQSQMDPELKGHRQRVPCKPGAKASIVREEHRAAALSSARMGPHPWGSL